MHFGLYLVRKERITADQFVAALEQQITEMVPLGELAVDVGMLTRRQLLEVLREQAHLPRESFGEAAIEQGAVSEADLAQLLKLQSDRRRPFADILVEQKVLSAQEAVDELAAFRRQRERGVPMVAAR